MELVDAGDLAPARSASMAIPAFCSASACHESVSRSARGTCFLSSQLLTFVRCRSCGLEIQ